MGNQKFQQVPWFGDYEGADAKTGSDALAAQHMVLLLQRMKHEVDDDHPLKAATVEKLQGAAAHYIISGNSTYGELIGLDPDDVARIGEEAVNYIATNFKKDWAKFLSGVQQFNDQRVAGFVPFARELLADRYPDEPQAWREARLGRYASAYVKDHGTPLFTAQGMSPMEFPGAADLPAEDRGEFKELKNSYHFGITSQTDRELREKHFLQKELAEMHKGASDADIDRRIQDKEYGERLTATFLEKDKRRGEFLAFAGDEIRKATEIEPANRWGKLTGIMMEYDRKHFPHMRDPGSPWHPSDRPSSALYKALSDRFAQSQKSTQAFESLPEEKHGDHQGPVKPKSFWRFGF